MAPSLRTVAERPARRAQTLRGARAAALAILAFGVVACGHVAPYQRAKLAHQTMDPDDAHSLGQEHMQAVQEGAIGGGVSATSGCGCN
jgi:Domain of unknown function (DUF4266)